MRKASYIVLFGSLGLIALCVALWILGFVFAPNFGNLIHLLLVLAVLTSFGVFVGLILLIVSFIKK
ncbi:MAG: lmo0937 family membrane protein [Pyrinomonadaceae bacterium]